MRTTLRLLAALLVTLPMLAQADGVNTPAWQYFRGGALIVMPEIYETNANIASVLGVHASLGMIKPISRAFGIGAEAGVGYYGRAEWDREPGDFDFVPPNSLSTVGFDAVGVFSYHASQRLFIRGRLGVALMVSSSNDFDIRENSYNAAPLLAVGMSYHIARQVKLAFDYTHISGRTYYQEINSAAIPLTKHPEFNTFQLGIEYVI